MAIQFMCTCKAVFSVPATMAGSKVPCSKCGRNVQVPGGNPNRTVIGQVIPEKGNATRLMEAFCSGPDYDPVQVFRSMFGNFRVMPLATHAVSELLWMDWRSLRGEKFEYFLVDVFESLGYRAEKKGRTNDKGRDVLVTIGTKRICIQAKGYEGTIGHGAVQEAHFGKDFWKYDFCMVITNSTFTDPAWLSAKGVKCGMIDGKRLPDLIRGLLIPPAEMVFAPVAIGLPPNRYPITVKPAPPMAIILEDATVPTKTLEKIVNGKWYWR